ncbi:hypothetical protein EVA_18995 [gut metagenome]|uniref:Uncharacterized protein n=1 Tax=gut metagenome TaxID=749906 RepID=J9FEP6_9ZZZZ
MKLSQTMSTSPVPRTIAMVATMVAITPVGSIQLPLLLLLFLSSPQRP